MQSHAGWPSFADLSRQLRRDGLPPGQGLGAVSLILMLMLEHGLVRAPLMLIQVRHQAFAQLTQRAAAQHLTITRLALLGMQLSQHPHLPAACSAAALSAVQQR